MSGVCSLVRMLQLSVWAVFCFACAAKHGVNAGVVERFRRGEPSGGPELQLQGSVARQTPTKNAFFPRKPSDELPLSFSEGLGGDASDPILEASAGPSGEPDATLEQGRPRPPDGEPSTKERQIPARQHTASPRGTRWLPYQRQQSRTASRRRRLEDVISTLRAEKEKMNTSAETSPQRVAIPRPAAAAGPSWGTPGTQSSAGGSPQRQVTPLSLEAVYTILQRAAAWVASRPSPFEKEPTVQAFATILSQYERFKLRVNRPAPEEKELVAGRVLGAGGMGVVFECWDPAAGAMYACKLSWLRPIPGASLTPKVVTMGMRKSIEEETAINSILGPSLSPETLRDQYALVVPSFSGHIVEKAGKPVYSYLLTSAFSRPFYNQVIGFWPAAASLIDVAMTPFITLDVSLFLVRRVIEIIAGLHSLGVVHADIKLDNFLVGHNGGIYLGDFGTALRPTARPRFKPPGTDVYLDAEAAEERLRTGGAKATIPRDSWALGITAYLLVCHRMPFFVDETSTSQKTLQSIIESAKRRDQVVFTKCLLPSHHPAAAEIHAMIREMLALQRRSRGAPLDLISRYPFLHLPFNAWMQKYGLVFRDPSSNSHPAADTRSTQGS